MLGARDCLVLERSLYNACLCNDFGGDGRDGTFTLGTDEVSDTTLGSSTGWGATTVDYGVNYDGNVG